MFKLAAALDQTLASLNDPILAALVLPHPEAFIRLFWVSLAVTAAVVPWLAHRERYKGRLYYHCAATEGSARTA